MWGLKTARARVGGIKVRALESCPSQAATSQHWQGSRGNSTMSGNCCSRKCPSVPAISLCSTEVSYRGPVCLPSSCRSQTWQLVTCQDSCGSSSCDPQCCQPSCSASSCAQPVCCEVPPGQRVFCIPTSCQPILCKPSCCTPVVCEPRC